MLEPAFGDEVLVRPSRPGLLVQEHGDIPMRMMPHEWTLRIWDYWLHRRYITGEIVIQEKASDSDAIPPIEPPIFQDKE